MINKIFPILLILLMLSGCSNIDLNKILSSKTSETNSSIQPPKENAKLDCNETTKQYLSELPNSFKNFDEGYKWCNKCVNDNGIPSRALRGVFCNYRTNDSGKFCTDSKQCEGKCLGQGESSTSGQCSPVVLPIGCNNEIFSGESTYACYD